ncbi:hypothetical protein PROFUN_05666 [Planoprotostelium fungivorum]|uniref:Uncharacterized protein n=1 Tax=Planoprotostelium fungivorum TaxID=1890364 RepID=A0A2P6MUG1_9EUKA|nr:hypothetical protein PROFUN_05666 [Planoprotostelium fungivorum]
MLPLDEQEEGDLTVVTCTAVQTINQALLLSLTTALDGERTWKHSNYDGSDVVYNDSPAGEKIKSVTPSTLTIPSNLHAAGEICLNDTWCASDLTYDPGHYCHQLNRTAEPDMYVVDFVEHWWRSSGEVNLELEGASPISCNVAGSNPIGTDTDTVDVYNNTRVQVIYNTDSVHVQLLDTENRTVEFWLSCVCVNDYASPASPTKLSLELAAATSSKSDIYTAPPTESRQSTAAAMSVGTLVIVCLALMTM